MVKQSATYALGLALLSSPLAQANVAVNFVESAPKDRFEIQNVDSCVLENLQLEIDLSSSARQLIFRIVNDGVMGGRSQSTITHSVDNTAIFKGIISLENNGGFASTRTVSRAYDLADYSGIMLSVQGDGKPYQFRLRTDEDFDGIAYRYEFDSVAGEWMEVKIPFAEFVPVFRGRVLDDAEPADPAAIQQLGFLFGNKQAEAFNWKLPGSEPTQINSSRS